MTQGDNMDEDFEDSGVEYGSVMNHVEELTLESIGKLGLQPREGEVLGALYLNLAIYPPQTISHIMQKVDENLRKWSDGYVDNWIILPVRDDSLMRIEMFAVKRKHEG